MTEDYDLVVVGGGTGGMAAARQARHRGRSVALVQDGPVGGDCTFTGCVPSKTLIEAAAQGMSGTAAFARMRATVAQIAAGEDAAVLRREGITVVEERARFLAPGAVLAGAMTLRARRMVVATGSRPVVPDVPGLDAAGPLTNETVFDLPAAPASLLVLGAGPVGCELAQALARLGTRVTLVESGGRLLAKEEPEVGEVVAAALRRDSVDVRLATSVLQVRPDEGGSAAALSDRSEVSATHILVATGRRARTDDLGCAAAGIGLDDRGCVRVDNRLATTAKGVYAAGDVTGLLPFTHAADQMGRVAAANALSPVPLRSFSARAVPWVTFTSPEVGRVGLTEAQAAPLGARVAWLPMTEVDRAIAAGETEGFVKLIAGPRRVTRGAFGGRVLGATVVASRGGELVHEAALAMRTGMFTGRLAQTTHAYPTWSLAVQVAAAQFFTETGGRRARPARG